MLQNLEWPEGGKVASTKQLVAGYMLLALETAMRLGELCNLRSESVDFDNRFITLTDTKNADERKVPMSKKAEALLKIVLASNIKVKSDVASAMFRRAVKNCGIENLSFHDTRHEAITRLAKKLDVLDLARMVGHRDPRSLMVYYNATPKEIAAQLD